MTTLTDKSAATKPTRKTGPARSRRGGRTTKSASGQDWWEQAATTLPAAENMPQKKRRRLRRLITGYIWVAVVMLPLTLLSVFVLAAQLIGRADTATPVVDGQGSVATAEAQLAVETWLNQTPAPVPGGRVVSFTGATSVTPEPDESGEPANYQLVTYQFVLADSATRLYTTSIQMAVSAAGSVEVAGPAVVPVPGTDPNAATGQWPWPGIPSGASNPGYQSAVAAWTRAYASGDPAELKQTVGDPDPARSYVPLSGVTLSQPSIDQVGQLWAEDQDRTENALPTQALLRVRVAATWAGQPNPASSEQMPTLTYDLLLDRADTAAPVVVAWGSPGTTLQPYGNALTGRTVVVASPGPSTTPEASTTPTTSASPTKKGR